MRVRRRDHLVCRWEADGLHVGVPGRRKWVVVDGDLAGLLESLGQARDVDELVCARDAAAGKWLRTAIDTLVELGIVVASGAVGDDEERGPWADWGTVAQRFHDESRDAFYVADPDQRNETVEAITSGADGPPVFKDYPDWPAVLLPRELLPLTTPVGQVFAARRTCRAFTGEPVGIEQVGTVLGCAFGTQRFLDGGAWGAQQGRVGASAGGRHEVEAYVVAHEVSGLPAGLYHYAPSRHALELLDDRVSRTHVAEVSFGQEPSFQGAFTVFTTAVVQRLAYKYRHPRAYRLWMYDAGHYAQVFALACAALGLGAFQTVAFTDSAVEALLGVDGAEEFAVYLLAAGVPAGFDPPLAPPRAPLPPAPLP